MSATSSSRDVYTVVTDHLAHCKLLGTRLGYVEIIHVSRIADSLENAARWFSSSAASS